MSKTKDKIMSGHSKWSTIRHKKALQDAKRANIFTKLGRLISVSAREGGGDIETNFKLKMAVEKARSFNMPKENIERAIKKGTGELNDGEKIEEIIYEAYYNLNGQQVALLIKTATDNRNRTVSEIRHYLEKNKAKLLAKGSLRFIFTLKGYLLINLKEQEKESEEIELLAIDYGAEEIKNDKKDKLIIVTKTADLPKVKEALEKKGVKITETKLTFLPQQTVNLKEEDYNQLVNFIEELEANDDVQEVITNVFRNNI